jgi:hypothetical protein
MNRYNKVYELLNDLKGTKSTVEEIANWFYMNRIYLHDIISENALELKEIPNWLEKLCFKYDSKVLIEGIDAIYEMLNSEVIYE